MDFTIHDLQTLWQYILAHWLVVSINFGAGMLLMWLIYGTLSYRRERRARRCVTMVQGTTIDEFEFRTPLTTIRITQSGRRVTRVPALSVQAPAAHVTSLLPGETYREDDDELTYYIPESGPLGMPLGFRIKRKVQLLFGLPPQYSTTVLLTPVKIKHEGTWFPAIVDTASGLMQLRHLLPKRIGKEYWKHGHRDRFVCDFVAKDDPIGSIQVGGRNGERIPVLSPCDGFILAYEVEKYAPVVPRANVMFIGKTPILKPIEFEGDRPGFMHYAKGHGSPVGRIVEVGETLCEVTSLNMAQEFPMPEKGLIVRQYANPGDKIQFGQKVFTYLPLEPLA